MIINNLNNDIIILLYTLKGFSLVFGSIFVKTYRIYIM